MSIVKITENEVEFIAMSVWYNSGKYVIPVPAQIGRKLREATEKGKKLRVHITVE